MRYFRQGPHDGLCGFFAALNGLWFLAYRGRQTDAAEDRESFFDEAVECLARVPGIDIRVLKGDPETGGIDQFQIRDLCRIMIERLSLRITAEIADPREPMSFVARYLVLLSTNEPFAIIAAHQDGSHWITAVPNDRTRYGLIDRGKLSLTSLNRGSGPRLASDAVVTLRPS